MRAHLDGALRAREVLRLVREHVERVAALEPAERLCTDARGRERRRLLYVYSQRHTHTHHDGAMHVSSPTRTQALTPHARARAHTYAIKLELGLILFLENTILPIYLAVSQIHGHQTCAQEPRSSEDERQRRSPAISAI